MKLQARCFDGGVWSWMLNDGQGSIRAVIGSTTSPAETRQYAPYGTPTQLLGSVQTEFGYTGEQTDGNKLINLRARHYKPGVGRVSEPGSV